MNDDLRHLQLLAIFHYVVAGMTALMGCFPIVHLAVGVAILSGGFSFEHHEPAAETFMGWMLTAIAGGVIVAMWSLAAVLLYAGRCIHERRRRIFCLFVAGLECLLMPFGTVLGVFAIIVLTRPSVAPLFSEAGNSTGSAGRT